MRYTALMVLVLAGCGGKPASPLAQEEQKQSPQQVIRLSPRQLWLMFQDDPIGMQTKKMRVAISGPAFVLKQPNSKGQWIVTFIANAEHQREGELAEIACLFPEPIGQTRGDMQIEGDVDEYAPKGHGGRIFLTNCKILK